jgi:protein-S-isoprenylcysteine O-methyltransferase Ste14
MIIGRLGLSALLFFLATATLVASSRRSILHASGYGWFRFMAFESLFLQLIHSAPFWFDDPWSILQTISWMLLMLSFGLAVHSFWLLHRYGAPENSIENTQHIVDHGAFGYIRHPLYTSLALFSWGVYLKHPGFPGGALSLGTTAFLIGAALHEERLNLTKFGDAYRKYAHRTKRFVPFIY